MFAREIPPGSPVIVVLVTQDGCPACEEYLPTFERAARAMGQGIPIVQVDADSDDPEAVKFMDAHRVESTPTVIAAVLGRGAIGKIEGVVGELETRRLFITAQRYNH